MQSLKTFLFVVCSNFTAEKRMCNHGIHLKSLHIAILLQQQLRWGKKSLYLNSCCLLCQKGKSKISACEQTCLVPNLHEMLLFYCPILRRWWESGALQDLFTHLPAFFIFRHCCQYLLGKSII